jgi:hypothetical protein
MRVLELAGIALLHMVQYFTDFAPQAGQDTQSGFISFPQLVQDFLAGSSGAGADLGRRAEEPAGT